jgi:hypothetical protein
MLNYSDIQWLVQTLVDSSSANLALCVHLFYLYVVNARHVLGSYFLTFADCVISFRSRGYQHFSYAHVYDLN